MTPVSNASASRVLPLGTLPFGGGGALGRREKAVATQSLASSLARSRTPPGAFLAIGRPSRCSGVHWLVPSGFTDNIALACRFAMPIACLKLSAIRGV